MPERRRPVAVWLREGRVNWVERVMKEWVVDFGALPVRRGDSDLRKRDNLCRRNRVSRPVPERLAEILSRPLPAEVVDRVGLGNVFSMILQNLLYIAAS